MVLLATPVASTTWGGELVVPIPQLILNAVGPLGVGVLVSATVRSLPEASALRRTTVLAGHGLSGQDDVLRGDIDAIAGRRGRSRRGGA